jgi:hypothetical protein
MYDEQLLLAIQRCVDLRRLAPTLLADHVATDGEHVLVHGHDVGWSDYVVDTPSGH